MLKGALIILLFWFLGEILGMIPGMPLPAGVLGMLLLCLALLFRIVELEAVKPVANALTQHLALFFVPPGIGLILYPDLLAKHAALFIVASVVSSLLVIWTVGKSVKK